MARVAEGMGRVANEIAANRKQRRDFLAEVKITTGHRQNDVRAESVQVVLRAWSSPGSYPQASK